MKKLRELFSPQPPGTPSAMLLLPRIFERRPWRTAKERTHPRCNSLTPAQVSPTWFFSLQRNCRGVLHLGRSLQSFLPWAAGLCNRQLLFLVFTRLPSHFSINWDTWEGKIGRCQKISLGLDECGQDSGLKGQARLRTLGHLNSHLDRGVRKR